MNTLVKKYLRGCTVMLLGGALFSLLSLPALANSAPGEPSTITSAFTVAENTPIEIQKEDLTFTVDPKTEKKAEVSAAYRMRNPTDANVAVSMLFPVLGDMGGGAVTVDGVAVEAARAQVMSLHFGGPIKDGVLMDISDIISIYNRTVQGVYRPQHFAPDDTLQVFTIHRSAVGRETVEYPAGSTLFAPENNGYSQDGGIVRLVSKGLGGAYAVYLLGGQSLTVDGAPAAPTSQTTMAALAVQLKSKVLNNAGADGADMTEQDYLNQFYRRVDERMDAGGVIAGTELFGATARKCTVLRYQVDFASGVARDVNVRYTIDAGYPAGYAGRKNYSAYEYLLNPAQYWASFKNLTITVIPGARRSRLFYSSLPMKRDKDGHYSTTFSSLPKQDFYFYLGAGGLSGGSVLPAVLCAAAAVALLSGILVWRRIKHRRGGR